MLNTNTNLFGFLLSQVGWSGDTATGRREFTSQGRTPFTSNQQNAQLLPRLLFDIWTNLSPIKGNSVNGFAPSQPVNRNTAFLPFFKIYRGDTPREWGGIIP